MYRIFVLLCVLAVCSSSVVYADEDAQKKIDELSSQIEELNIKLSKLTDKLKSSMTNQDLNMDSKAKSSEQENADNKEDIVEDKPANLDEILAAIEEIAKNQEVLKGELDHLKKYVEPHTITNDEMDQVYVGEKTSENGAVLYNYGDANEYDDSDNVYYVEPESSKPSVHFYIGGGRSRYWRSNRYYDDWDGPWAVTPPWWVRQKYYERHR